jgi:MoaA/NifB/PqqE/SkfB family radical SAM enzyme
MTHIDHLKAPLFVSWQLTRECDLACLHCCTESAPGKRVAGELDAAEALAVARKLIHGEVPYVMLCGGEPLIVPHFFEVAGLLGDAGVQLKIETNGQRLDAATVERLARLPIRSIQISLDGATDDVYARQRPGASLARAHAACRAVRAAGLPLEVTFAPSRLNIHQVEQVIEQAAELGAFRFNTGKLMRIGTAARLWNRLEPNENQYQQFRQALERRVDGDARMELCYIPFSIQDGLTRSLADPPATLLVLPNGWVKVAAALPHVCGDLRQQSLAEVWSAYRHSWRAAEFTDMAAEAIASDARHVEANAWQRLIVHDNRPAIGRME